MGCRGRPHVEAIKLRTWVLSQSCPVKKKIHYSTQTKTKNELVRMALTAPMPTHLHFWFPSPQATLAVASHVRFEPECKGITLIAITEGLRDVLRWQAKSQIQ